MRYVFTFFLFLFLSLGFGQSESLQFAQWINRLEQPNNQLLIPELEMYLSQASESPFRDSVSEMLGTLYWGQKNWKALKDLYQQEGYDSSEIDMFRFIAALSQSPKEEIIFPLDRSPIQTKGINKLGHLHLPCIVNGKKTNGLFDTGAGISLVSESFAKKHGIHRLETATGKATSASGFQIPMQAAYIDSLRFGDLLVKNTVVGIVPDASLEFKRLGIKWVDIDFIFGWTLLQDLGIQYNREEKTMEIGNPDLFECETVNLFWYSIPMIHFYLEGDSIEMLTELDFGGWESNTYNVFFETHPELLKIKKTDE
ncbi:MAG: retroviral-like aspartic protease family protein, partial [Bacteroidota bacterium]|nr:retroviral-like aspartic protease family protein [Bacteroidota bacterium]MDX5430129.1 retroviral-like aspartic protease family protein [Bacteroidota bacterium]MDX5468890.1 retroviral-like aspartic protease family protein [Bacteroidota bacterium]